MAPRPVKFYKTTEVAALTGVSRRQLQYWDEHDLLKPQVHQSHVRLYSKDQLDTVRRVGLLRAGGVPFSRIPKLLKLNWSSTLVSHRNEVMVDDCLVIFRAH